MKNPVSVAALPIVPLIAAVPAATLEWRGNEDPERPCNSFLADSGGDGGALCLARTQEFNAGSGTADLRLSPRAQRTLPRPVVAERQ